MQANFVDRLLARVDGELASIWITALYTTDAPPTADALREALAELVGEVERLRLRWDPKATDWAPAPRTAATLAAAVRERSAARSGEHTQRLVRETVDLERELPLRITVAPLLDTDHGATLLAVQLHHAIGDARSLMHLVRRLWELLAKTPAPRHELGTAQFSDRRALALAAHHARALPHLAHAKHRVLARRGQALRRRDADVGAPMLLSLRVPLHARFAPVERSALFYGALLAGVLAHQGDEPWSAPLRLRIPVDLRRELGIGPTLENACSAVPVEIAATLLRSALADPDALGRLVPDELARLIASGVHFGTLVECLLVSRFASAKALRSHVRPDLLSRRRASTLVTTYVGSTDRYNEAPFPIRTLRTHTPTWGANGLTLGDALVLNVSGFEGIWTRADLERFVMAMAKWLAASYGLEPQVIA